MVKGLKGKAAIVTGGAYGIGRACVERLCEEGCSVTFFSGISDIGAATERELKAAGHAVAFVRGDMAKEVFCQELVESAAGTWGRVDYPVNNAFSFTGIGESSSFAGSE